MIILTRQLLLFYQPEKDTAYLEQYAAQLTVMPTGDSWVWLVCLLIKKVLLPSIKHPFASHLFSRLLNDPDHHIRIMTFTLYHTPVFKTIIDQDSDSSDDDDDNDNDDVVMQEAKQPSLVISPLILARLESLYASDRIHELLYSFIQQQQSGIESIASFFNTLMLRWPSKKDSILNTLLYKSRQKTAQPSMIHQFMLHYCNIV
ncbi:uncharacterized protein B0P05DRAFT_534008 [Gilbertella persicaria]|uniref:uncharacterized protein n=1 Tax=Gilbertella persicaria TaxID=101096 RepID=UPI00221F35B5|nr:uncharacterized protein B0P05DRAFT_534008 [Gilbertella persicaria]KAI8085862.1 hypothetical protein B0P05DRAFT_534008 [Gilbertella persicaria]